VPATAGNGAARASGTAAEELTIPLVKTFAALALLLAGAWARAGVNIEHWVAPSGAQVYFVETHVLPIVDVQIDFAAGSAYDPPEKTGLAGLTQALLDAGAGDLHEEQIAGKLADTGALMYGSSDPDRATLALRTLSGKLERDDAVALMALVLQQPRFPSEVLEREKARAISAVREEDTQPEGIAAKRFAAAIYPSHAYGLIAEASTLERITRDDVTSFYRAHYAASHSVVTIVGDLSRGEAQALAEKLTSGLPPATGGRSIPAVQLPKRELIRVAHPATQSHIRIGMPAVRRGDPDYIALLVGNEILGGGSESRLVRELREKRGLAYSVASTLQPYREPGPFEIALQTRRDQAEEALKLVERTLKAFLKNGPSERELKGAKLNLINGFALRLDSNKKILDHVATIGFYGLPLDYLERFPRRVAAVSAAQVREAFARRVRAEHLVSVVVGEEP
jgi:zinc protease